MNKVDFKRELKQLYNPSQQVFSVVDVPAMQFLMIDGQGDPNVAQAYPEAVEALYAVAYKLKFASKQALGRDYAVPPLEGLWWADDMDSFTVARDKTRWQWTMLIMQPAWITSAMVAEARAAAGKQKALPALPKLRLESYAEGLAVQILHVGSYEAEAATLHQLHHEFMPANGYAFNGRHHEIYLSDPRRVAADKLKTILRQPVVRISETAPA